MNALFLDDQGRVRNGWKLLAYVLLVSLLGLALERVAHILPARLQPPMDTPWGEFLLLLGAAWICLAAEGQPLVSLGFRPGARWAREFALGTLGGMGIIALTALLVRALGGFHWTRTPGIGLASLASGAWVYLGVAFAEETGFRGYPFQRLIRGAGFPIAQAAFAFCFARAHWGNPGMSGATRIWATVNIGLAAILLGYAYQRTGSLALPIGIHLGWNWTQGSLLGFGVSGMAEPGWWTPVFHGRPAWLTGGAFGLEASLPCVLVCGLAILGLARWRGNAPQDEPAEP